MELENISTVGPIQVRPDNGENLGNWKTKIYETEGTKYILKVDSRILKEVVRQETESEDDYSTRRTKWCFEFINNERKDEKQISNFVPEGIDFPKEHHLIIDGDDGFPVVARVQNKVEGKLLKDVKFEELSAKNKEDLNRIVDYGIKSFIETGKVLDITGWSGKGEGRFKWLLLSITKPLEGSSNIFLSNDGNIVIIDLKSSFPGDSLPRKIGRFIHFAGLVAYKIRTQRSK